jgi:hypothetical protein
VDRGGYFEVTYREGRNHAILTLAKKYQRQPHAEARARKLVEEGKASVAWVHVVRKSIYPTFPIRECVYTWEANPLFAVINLEDERG